MKSLLTYIIPLGCILAACSVSNDQRSTIGFQLQADAETQPIKTSGDAADDPAIWVHPTLPNRSLVFGSDKEAGIYAYDLSGKQKASYPFGKINNIDVIYGFPIDSVPTDLLAGTNTTLNTLEIYKINPKSGLLKSYTSEALFSSTKEVYGLCTYKSRVDSQCYVFVSGKEGEIEQWKLRQAENGLISGDVIRTLQLNGKCEGMVADNELGFLYVAEEDNAIWRLGAEPNAGDDRFLVSNLEGNPQLSPDLEGLTLYTAADKEGFLIVSSQGNHSYAIFKRTAPYPYLGSFQISSGSQADETSETDGIAVSNVSLGPNFPHGLFVAQDGQNQSPEGQAENQNFKYVSWKKIADSLGIHALIDTSSHPRKPFI